MRGLDNVEHAEVWVIVEGKRLVWINVDGSAGNFSALDGFSDGDVVKAFAAGAVDEMNAILHFRDGVGIDHVAGFFGERRVDGDVVRFREQGVEIDELDADLVCAFFSDVWVVTDDVHFKRLHALGHTATDTTNTDDAQRASLQLNAREALAVPLAFLDGLVRLWNVAGDSEHHADGMLNGCDGVAFRCIADDDAASSRCRNVDVVNADAGAADNLEIVRSGDDFFSHLRLAAGDKAIVLADAGEEFFRRHVGLNIDIEVFTQNGDAFFADVIAN